jgi:hypothetical protein
MKLSVKVAPKIIVEVEEKSQKEAFEALASAFEVFGESQCGKCNSGEIKPVVREVDGNKYYEMKCNNCFAVLQYGAHKNNVTLFPKRKNDDETYNQFGGWKKWNRDKQCME